MEGDYSLDWYSLSKLNTQNPDLNKFSQIIEKAHLTQGIDRVTQHYRKRLLLMFQNAYHQIKQKTPELMVDNSELQVKKSIVGDKLQNMQGQLEQSFKEITNMKYIVAEKKRLLAKLKQKLKKKGKALTQKVYCCTVCNRQDFKSIDSFRNHMEQEHNQYLFNKSSTSNEVTELKDLLMTMKDKEIQMMSMFLQANKEMNTQKLEKEFDSEYRKYMHLSGTKTEESKEQGQPAQLKAESQFLFFQKSDQFRREMERDQEFRRKVSLERTQRQNNMKNNSYQPKDYYNVFGNIEENKSEHIDQSSRRKETQQKQIKNYAAYEPTAYLSKILHQYQPASDSRFTLLQTTPRPYVEGNMPSKQTSYVAPSISDRLKQPKGKPVETIYSTKRKFYEDKGYVFNAGPLLDEKGDGSDYEDYFGDSKPLDASIQDEEIKINQINQSSYQHLSRDSLFLSKLLSPKNQSGLSQFQYDKSIKDKSSVIVDLSDSFSKRDFELSKDDETINLSDLKLSKLEKKKQEERIQYEKSRANDKAKQAIKIQTQAKAKISRPTLGPQAERQLSPNATGVLRQFQRQKINPMVEQSFRFNKTENSLNMFIKPNERANIIGGSPQRSAKETGASSVGILSEFLREQFKGQEQSRNYKKKGELEQFIKR